MKTIEASLGVPAVQPQMEQNVLAPAGSIFYDLGLVTHESLDIKKEILRSLSLRQQRAELLHKLLLGQRTRGSVLYEAHFRDKIARQYLRQGDLRVSFEGLGDLTARYSVIERRKFRRKKGAQPLPPVVVIPGISHDIGEVESLVCELAYRGRDVNVIAYPDSTMGRVTPEFAQAVHEAPNAEPHAEFFKHAIAALVGDQEFELWGFSMGAAICADILKDSSVNQNVTNAVFISPAGVVDQSQLKLTLGVLQESVELVKHPHTLPSYSYVLPTDKPDTHDPQNQSAIKDRIFGDLKKRAAKRLFTWETLDAREGAHIVFVVGRRDYLTQSAKGMDPFRDNPKVRIMEIADGSHNSAITRISEFLPEIFELQK